MENWNAKHHGYENVEGNKNIKIIIYHYLSVGVIKCLCHSYRCVRPVRSMLRVDFSSSIIFYCFTSAFVVVLSFGENQTSHLKTLGAVAIRQRTRHICEPKKNIHAYLILFGLLHSAVFGIIALGKLFCSGLYYNFSYTSNIQMCSCILYIVLCSASIDEALESLELFKNKIATPEGDRSVFFFHFCRKITNHSRHFLSRTANESWRHTLAMRISIRRSPIVNHKCEKLKRLTHYSEYWSASQQLLQWQRIHGARIMLIFFPVGQLQYSVK